MPVPKPQKGDFPSPGLPPDEWDQGFSGLAGGLEDLDTAVTLRWPGDIPQVSVGTEVTLA